MKTYEKRYTMTFKDGEVVSYTYTEYVVMKAIEKVCTKGMPITCDIKRFYNNGIFRSSVIGDSLAAYVSYVIFEVEWKSSREKHRYIQEISKASLVAFKEIYEQVWKLGYYNLTGLSLHQMLSLQDTSSVREAVSKLKAPIKGERYFKRIEKVYDSIEDALSKLKRGPHNTIHSSYYGGLASPNQFKQMYGVCGYSSNLVNEIANKPVLSSYVSGLNTTTELVLGAKAAVIAVYFGMTAIKSAEYYSRRVQTALSSLRWVSTKDCGTKDGMPMTFIDDGMMLGMSYKYQDNPDGKWIKCTPNNKPKKGDKIILRNINHCDDPRGDTCCIGCAGEFAYHKPKGHNYGLWMITKQTEIGNQQSLSVKHFLSSAVVTAIFLKEKSNAYIMKNNAIYLKESENFLRFPSGTSDRKSFSGEGIVRNSLSVDIGDMNINALSVINTLQEVEEGKGSRYKKIEISQDAFLSREVLEFIREKGSIISDSGSTTSINLEGFDKSKPILNFIALSVNYKTIGERARALIVSSRKKDISISKEELFQQLIEAYNPTLKVNYSIVASMLYTMSINYSVSKHDTRNSRMGIGKETEMTSLDKYLGECNTADRMLIGSSVEPLRPHELHYSETSHNIASLIGKYDDVMELLDNGEIK